MDSQKTKPAPDNQNTYAETIGILEDLTSEFILLESIRQCAIELCGMMNDNNYLKHETDLDCFIAKFNELKHLVITE